jgi:hypothetical protein
MLHPISTSQKRPWLLNCFDENTGDDVEINPEAIVTIEDVKRPQDSCYHCEIKLFDGRIIRARPGVMARDLKIPPRIAPGPATKKAMAMEENPHYSILHREKQGVPNG